MTWKKVDWWISGFVLAVAANLATALIMASLLDDKDQYILELKQDLSDLKTQASVKNNTIDNIDNKVSGFSESLSSLSDVSKDKQLAAIKAYREYVENLTIVRKWLKETGNDAIQGYPYGNYAQNISKTIILESIKTVCTGYTFHLWFEDPQAHVLPKPVAIGLARFFQSLENSCYKVPENIDRIAQDSWYVNVGFRLSGQLIMSESRIAERYEEIMRAAREILKIMSEEQRRLQ